MEETRRIDRIRQALLDLYRTRARELPWRRDRDPYRVWVSEVMLQQTRVETVIPYYERWLERFPTLQTLADATIDDVLREWAGLGYYRRARYLHRAAGIVREHHGGQLPADLEALRALPGIGDYTAGAVASIAFGIAEPAIDGNVRRVVSRLYDLPDPRPAELRRIASALVPDERPGEFNQAIMEFGATICAPRSPSCEECPLTAECRAYAAGTQRDRPRPKRAAAVPEITVATAVITDSAGRVLLRRRPEDGLLGGMWEFPGESVSAENSTDDTRSGTKDMAHEGLATGSPSTRKAATRNAVDTARHVAHTALAAVDGQSGAAGTARAEADGERLGEPHPLGAVDHAFSHLRVQYHAFAFELDSGSDGPDPTTGRGTANVDVYAWVGPDDVDRWALPAAQRRIEALRRAHLGSPTPESGTPRAAYTGDGDDG